LACAENEAEKVLGWMGAAETRAAVRRAKDVMKRVGNLSLLVSIINQRHRKVTYMMNSRCDELVKLEKRRGAQQAQGRKRIDEGKGRGKRFTKAGDHA
jgi:hypothetical protein